MKTSRNIFLSNLILVSIIFIISAGNVFAQLAPRLLDTKQHRNGKLWAMITNFGQFGSNIGGAIFPGSDALRHRYINRGGLILGGIVDADGTGRNAVGSLDTLVSEGPSMWSVVDFREMLPHYSDSRSLIEQRSNIPGSQFFHPDAVSEEDFISVYTDTFTAATGLGPAKHVRALGLEIVEKSYQFSTSFMEDIVFFDIEIKNIGNNNIGQFYIGFFADNDVVRRGAGVPNPPNRGQRDDASGFMEINSAGVTVNTAWVSEPDGDNGNMPGVVGVRVLQPTTGRISYNWWMSDSDVGSSSDWGPRTADTFSGVLDPNDPHGSPEEDEDKYVVMINGSFDSPQYDFTTNSFNPDIPVDADPNDNSRFMISAGPLGTETGNTFATPRGGEPETLFKPGESVRFVYAVIGGEGNEEISDAIQATDPAAFVDLGLNAALAQRFFDSGFQEIVGIIVSVEALGLNNGNTNSLVSKLENAIKSIDNGNDKAAGNQLKAFTNQVRALVKAKKISSEDGNSLIASANAIISSLSSNVAKAGNGNIPETFRLEQNYPNPFNPTTTIQFQIPETSHVTLEIFNISGALVKTLVSENLSAGFYSRVWDGTNESGQSVASGVYLSRIRAGSLTTIKRLMFIK